MEDGRVDPHIPLFTPTVQCISSEALLLLHLQGFGIEISGMIEPRMFHTLKMRASMSMPWEQREWGHNARNAIHTFLEVLIDSQCKDDAQGTIPSIHAILQKSTSTVVSSQAPLSTP